MSWRVVVTGGAGFIGRWVVGELLDRGLEVLAVDNLVAGDAENLAEFGRASCRERVSSVV